jgi:hypothetical protein
MRINEWLAREKQERTVRVECALGDVCGRVFVGGTRVIDGACGEAIHQQHDVTRRYGTLGRALDHRFGQSGAAVKGDERREGPISFRFRKKAPKSIATNGLWDLSAFECKTFLQLIKWLSGPLEFDKLRGCCKGVCANRND